MSKFLHLLTDTVTIAPVASVSNYGDPTLGAQSQIAARVEYDKRLITGTDGSELEVTHVIASDSAIAIGDRVWLPGANVANVEESQRVVFVKIASTPDGLDTMYEARV